MHEIRNTCFRTFTYEHSYANWLERNSIFELELTRYAYRKFMTLAIRDAIQHTKKFDVASPNRLDIRDYSTDT